MGSNLLTGSGCALAAFCLGISSLPISAAGVDLAEARITAVVHEVNLAAVTAPMPLVAVKYSVGIGTTVTTSAHSRMELTFNDGAVARLGTNAVLSLKSRDLLELSRGAVLIDVLPGAKVKIQANGIGIGMAGGTGILEYQSSAFKFLVLAGTGRVYRPGHLGDSVLVHPGQMVFGSANADLFDPVDFDIIRFAKTSRLIQSFAPLQSEKSMVAASESQQREKSKKILIETNLVMGEGTAVTVVDRTKAAPAGNLSEHSAVGTQSSIPVAALTPPSNEMGR
jgi:hypothetical protein